MLSNRSMPSSTVIPELVYDDVRAASGWLCRAFGFTERLLIGDHRVQLSIGGGDVIVCEPAVEPDGARLRAPRHDEAAHAVMVRVEDVDAHWARARRNGASIAREPADQPYGERQYGAVDPGGHRWTFSQSVADVAPEDWGGAVPR